MENVNTTNLLGKKLKITYDCVSKTFSLFDCQGNLVKTDTDGNRLTKIAWNFYPQQVVFDFDLRLVET
jgi:hypothetical protein